MRRLLVATLLCLLLSLLGCTATTTPRQAQWTLLPATILPPTATPTARPIPTPTSTHTPTAIPTPTHTPTPPPLFGTLEVEPAEVYPGRTLLVRLHSTAPATPSAFLADEGLRLFPLGEGEQYAAVVGIWIWSEPGQRTLSATWQDALGREATVTTTVEVLPGEYPVENINLPPGRESLLDPQIIEEEWAYVRPILEEITPERLWEGSFITPTEGYVSSPYGTLRSYNDGPPSSSHNGVDISNITGTLIIAPAKGRVVLAERLQVRGYTIILDHGLGVHTSYFHMSALEVEVGDLVDQGQPIGRIGATGLVTGAHLHWELRLGMITVDPLEWVHRELP